MTSHTRKCTTWCIKCCSISKHKIPAVCIAAQNPHGTRYYHTRQGTPDDMDINTVKRGLNISLSTLFTFDRLGYETKKEREKENKLRIY